MKPLRAEAYDSGSGASGRRDQTSQGPVRAGPDLILLNINMPVRDGRQFQQGQAAMPKPPGARSHAHYLHDPQDMARARSFPAVQGFFPQPLSNPMLDQAMGLAG
jgi:CheY-like chemotaxis protein